MTIGSKIPDFVNINGQKKIIELFGSYWHKDYDEYERTKYFRQFGWDTLVIWDYELERNEELLLNKLNDFILLEEEKKVVEALKKDPV